jgi:hypothetical protein
MPRPDYLRVDAFLSDAIGARALATAFELGLIDRLVAVGPAPAADRPDPSAPTSAALASTGRRSSSEGGERSVPIAGAPGEGCPVEPGSDERCDAGRAQGASERSASGETRGEGDAGTAASARGRPGAPEPAPVTGRLDAGGAALLLGALRASGVLAAQGEPRLSDGFRHALRYRELLEAKLAMLAVVGADFLELFTPLVADPARFQRCARLFELFAYDRALEPTPENLAHVSRWVRFTTALTREEAPALLDATDLSGCRRLLDVGGNSGEFAVQACRRHPGLRATVLDLPVVCLLGERHVAGLPEAPRIGFQRSCGTSSAFPPGHDAIVFKSMLHDWPDAQALGFLRRAREALAPGGRVWILERAAPVPDRFDWSALPVMLFARSYRVAEDYRRMLDAAGLACARVSRVELDLPFHVIEAEA